jgi:hypothetical protein
LVDAGILYLHVSVNGEWRGGMGDEILVFIFLAGEIESVVDLIGLPVD